MIEIPADVKQPQDRQPKRKSAAQLETEKIKAIEITWRDRTFTIAADMDDWPVEVTEAMEDGKAVAIVRGLLGPKQWLEFKATRPRNHDLNELSEVLAKALGFNDTGE